FSELKNELGDLLFQVVFYAQMGKEQGLFDFNDIVEGICENKRVFGLVIDFGTSQSPKSTRPLTTYWCPSRPGHQALRNNFASSLLLRTWLPYDWTPRSEAYFVFPLAQGTPGKQCGLAATGDYQTSLRSPWLAANDPSPPSCICG
ncbi:MazG nucleotide pyrophosphohydrolase domain-containing protein, partial [Thiolapillus sp.]|uniref:MazG nucleotide pyrophosphohydrolase domain-containing protein n=1 Tax=Thiolapillus sp. TaxID=2017437 RepID=UPI003AF50074